MSFAGARGQLRAATFAAFGEAATWNGVACTVRVSAPDQVLGLRDAEAIAESVLLKVRRVEVVDPLDGNVVAVGAQNFRVVGDPTADAHREVWTCQAKRIAP